MGRTPCLACRLVTPVGQPANWPTPQGPRGAAGRVAVRGASEVSPSLWKRAEAAWSRCGGGLADWPRLYLPRGPGCCGKRGEHQRQEKGRDGMTDGTSARRSQISLLNQSAGENKWRRKGNRESNRLWAEKASLRTRIAAQVPSPTCRLAQRNPTRFAFSNAAPRIAIRPWIRSSFIP